VIVMDSAFIPVVDFVPFVQNHTKEVAKEVFDAFQKVGFVYLKYPQLVEKAQEVFLQASIFFSQPLEEKMKVKRGDHPEDVLGYIPVGAEKLSNNDVDEKGSLVELKHSTDEKIDHKESFQIYSNTITSFENRWPDLPGFKETMINFYNACDEANVSIMQCIATALGLDTHYFDKICEANALRLLHYPILSKKELGSVRRAGAHTDYGSITLLFQDDIGGLQVMNAKGEFEDVKPIPDTVIVNAADMLQRWTNGKLKSTVHRVVLPTKATTDECYHERFSIAYFCTPNMDLSIECLPGCEGDTGPLYPSIKSRDYLLQRITGHY